MNRQITFLGKKLNLVGRSIEVTDPAPDFKVVSDKLEDVTLENFKGKIKLIHTFPSLDTPVCDLQIKEFNKVVLDLSKDLVILGISKDLPFAQNRFCIANKIENVKLYSDYKYNSFGINYGLLIKEFNLLARAALVLDKLDTIVYIQIADELTNNLNYQDIFESIKKVLASKQDAQVKKPLICKACEGLEEKLKNEQIKELLKDIKDWKIEDNKKLIKEFRFDSFEDAKYFVDLIANLASEQNHHPTITLSYNKVRITLTTHYVGGLSENDFTFAKIIDDLNY